MSLSKETQGRKGIMAPIDPQKKISSVYFDQEDKLWECESTGNLKERNSDGRSKSQGNSTEKDPSYSHSIKDVNS